MTDATALSDSDLAAIRDHVKSYAGADDRRAWRCLGLTMLAQAAAFGLYAIGWTALAVPFEALVLLRAFMVYHDGIHNSYFRRRNHNDWLIRLMQMWVFTPVGLWKKNHLDHHRWLGNLDIHDRANTILFTRQQFDSWPRLKRLFARVFRSPPVFFSVVPAAQWGLEYPLRHGNVWLYLGHALHLLIAWQLSWWHLLAMYLSAMVGLTLFHLQHGLNPSYKVRGDEWDFARASILGSTYVPIPPVLRWFTLGIEFHHIHHLNAAVPSYRLETCHRSAPGGMWRAVTSVSFLEGLKSLRNVMWDEDTGRLVPF